MAVQAAALGADLVGHAGGAAAGVWAERFGQLLVAENTIEQGANPAGTTECGEGPGAVLEGGFVTDVLAVPAFEQGHPLPFIVRLEADDGPLHGQ